MDVIQKIKTSQLIPGMYVHELHCAWIDHPFMKNQFVLKSSEDIQKVINAKIEFVSIDISKGVGLPEDSMDVFPTEEKQAVVSTPAVEPEVKAPPIDINQSINHAKTLVSKASNIAKQIMDDVTHGKDVDMAAATDVASSITRMLEKDHHTLLGVARLKNKDEYTFQHSVSVAALVAAFAKHMEYTAEKVDQIAIGGLLHDIGKSLTPLEVLNKPGKLTDDEFFVMRQHAIGTHSQLLLDNGMTQLSLDVITQHHERPDGKGYPLGVTGDALSQAGRMASIADVYDALTSVRIYKDAWEPSVALKNMLSWTPGQFDRDLLLRFIKMLGIYPVGSVVELESGNAGIILNQTEDSLRPIIKLIYNMKLGEYIQITEVDLSKKQSDAIKRALVPEDHGIDVAKYY